MNGLVALIACCLIAATSDLYELHILIGRVRARARLPRAYMSNAAVGEIYERNLCASGQSRRRPIRGADIARRQRRGR